MEVGFCCVDEVFLFDPVKKMVIRGMVWIVGEVPGDNRLLKYLYK